MCRTLCRTALCCGRTCPARTAFQSVQVCYRVLSNRGVLRHPQHGPTPQARGDVISAPDLVSCVFASPNHSSTLLTAYTPIAARGQGKEPRTASHRFCLRLAPRILGAAQASAAAGDARSLGVRASGSSAEAGWPGRSKGRDENHVNIASCQLPVRRAAYICTIVLLSSFLSIAHRCNCIHTWTCVYRRFPLLYLISNAPPYFARRSWNHVCPVVHAPCPQWGLQGAPSCGHPLDPLEHVPPAR